MIPAILGLVPFLVKEAEAIFGGDNDAKSAGIMGLLELIYDKGLVKMIHDFPGIDEKKLFMRMSQVLVEELLLAK